MMLYSIYMHFLQSSSAQMINFFFGTLQSSQMFYGSKVQQSNIEKMQANSYFRSNPKAFIFESKNLPFTISDSSLSSAHSSQVKDRAMFTSSIQIGSQTLSALPSSNGFKGLQSFGRCVDSEVEREKSTTWQSANECLMKKQQVKVLSFRNVRGDKGKMTASTIVAPQQQMPSYSFKFPVKTGQSLTAFSPLDALMTKNKKTEVRQEFIDETGDIKKKEYLLEFKKNNQMSASVFLNGEKPVFKLPTRRNNQSTSINSQTLKPLSNVTNQTVNQKQSLIYKSQNTLIDNKPSISQENITNISINMFKKKTPLQVPDCPSSPQRILLKLLSSDKIIKEQLKIGKSQNKLSKSDFAIGKAMGKGQFGEVFLVVHKATGFLCGMKVMSKKQIRQEKYVNQIARQLSIQSYLSHRFIAPLYGFFEDSDNLYLLIQFCSEGQLYQKLRKSHRLEQEQTSMVLRQVCEGLDYIHKQEVIHRDIKPENIMFQFGTVKICDFGWAVYHNNQLRKTVSGTPLYYSPELVMESEYDDKIDVWSIGMMAYECLLGKIPFKIYSQFDLKRIVEDQVSFPEYVDVSDDAKNFILRILKKKPQQRMGIREMLRHPFISKYAKCSKVSEQSLAEFRKILSN